jgi:predicted ATPase
MTYRIAHAGFIGSHLHEEYTCYGRGVNLAARFMTQAPWSEIWLDEEVARRARRDFDIVHAGDFPFKGFAAPQPVFRLLQRRETVETFYRGQLVGRSEELAQLEAFMRPILEEQRYAGILIVRGEAGIGKSRLVHEFRQQAGSKIQWFRCQTDQILRQFLNPFRYFLRQYFEQSVTQTAEENRQAFDRQLDDLLAATHDPELKQELNRVRSFLAALVDLYWPDSLYHQVGTEARYSNTFKALITLMKAESLRRPVVIQLEDVHWLDEDSVQFLEQLTRNLGAFPIAIVATMRPQGEERIEILPEQAELLELRALSARFLSDLTEAVLGEPASARLIQLLAKQADGNPFFAEQILLYLQEQNSLDRRVDSQQRVTIDLANTADEFVLPTDVRSVLVARLDRLAPKVKQIVLTASVLGREFELGVLTQMMGEGESLLGQVDTAVKAAVWSPLTGERYLFRHALLSDTAYNTQLLYHRRRLHQRAAEVMEALYAADLSPHFGILAHHFEQAGNTAKTCTYLECAGDTAKEAYQNTAALGYYKRLLTLLTQILETPTLSEPDKLTTKLLQADILFKQGQVTEHIGRWNDAELAYSQALALIEETTEQDRKAAILAQLGVVYHLQEQFETAELHYRQALHLYEQLDNEQGQASVLGRLGYLSWRLEAYEQTMTYCEQGIRLCQKLGDKRGTAQLLSYISLALIERQEYEQALTVNEEALALDEDLGYPQGIAIHLANMGGVYLEIGEIDKSLSYQQSALQIHRELGYTRGILRHLGNIANAYFYKGEYEMALKYLEQSLPLVYELGSKAEMAWQLLDKAKNLIQLERYTEAREANEAGSRAALEAHYRPYIFTAILQEAKIAYHLGNEAFALQQLYEMLAETEAPNELAELYYELWRFTGDIKEGQMALHYYQQLMARSAHIEYRHRVEELETAVPQVTT